MMAFLGRWLQSHGDMLTVTTALRLIAIAIASASVAWLFVSRTDPERAATLASQPYAVISIDPDSIHMIREVGSSRWSLGYVIRVHSKTRRCERINSVRTLDSLDVPGQALTLTVPTLPMVPVSDDPAYVADTFQLPSPLDPGSYFVAAEVTCLVRDDSGVLIGLANPAQTLPQCFTIPALRGGEDVVPAMPFDCVKSSGPISSR